FGSACRFEHPAAARPASIAVPVAAATQRPARPVSTGVAPAAGAAAAAGGGASAAAAAANYAKQLVCKHGSACRRNDCYYRHPERDRLKALVALADRLEAEETKELKLDE